VQADRSVDVGAEKDGQGLLFRIPQTSSTSIHKEKRLTIVDRADAIARVVEAEASESWLIWVDTDYEADAVTKRLPQAVEVRGSMKMETKEERLNAFTKGEVRVLVTKPSIAGYGLNWQHCARMAFVGLSFSYESYYQAVRRCWRFGQKREVHVHVAMADTERAIWDVVTRKADDHDAMKIEMAGAMKRAVIESKVFQTYQPDVKGTLPAFLKGQ
jgi:superfamily II DNA/RNA helicase